MLNIGKIVDFQNKIIVQELLNIRKDLRVIVIGNEIFLHYWRINLGGEWRPTSTGFGSKVDFINYPNNGERKS